MIQATLFTFILSTVFVLCTFALCADDADKRIPRAKDSKR